MPDGHLGRSGRRRSHARRRGLIAVVAAGAATVLTASACTSTTTNGNGASPVSKSSPNGPASTDSSSSSTPDAVITTSPTSSTNINPASPITVNIADGTLTAVTLVNTQGKAVRGALAAGGASWQNTEDLGYSKTYRLSASGVSSTGKSISKAATFTTLTPNNQTMPYMQRPGGFSLDNGSVYGVGIVPVVHFDESITNKKAAEQALSVTTVPHVDGVWNWVDDQNVHFRPAAYWPSGTKVTVTAKVYGVQVGHGLYGQQDKSVSFTIGAKHVAIADDATHLVKVYFNGKLVRTMPTAMGRGGYVSGTGGQQIPLWTMPGTYTVLTHENPATMSSDSYGLPANSPAGYAPEKVYWSTKISVDGIYLHELDATVWAQGHQDVSHGCLNLNYDNAKWYYQSSLVGDVVTVIHVHTVGGQTSAPVQVWQNGDWTVPWSTWIKGSAL